MIVLYIDHTAKIGGGEVALANLVRYIDRDVVQPIVLLFEDGPLVRRLPPDLRTIVLPLSASARVASKDELGPRSLLKLTAGWEVLRHIIRVARLARKLNVDIIHTNSLKADIIGGFAGRLAGIPVVWHVRDRIAPDYLPAPVVSLFRRLSRVIPAHVIANSEATLATVQLNGKRPGTAIGSGVALDSIAPPDGDSHIQPYGSNGQPSNGARLGLVGRISPWKGQHIFLKAAAQILEEHPNTRFELIGAALFSEKVYEAELHDLCRSLGIEHAVEFVGFVDDVPARVAELDILVHASTTGEPFGQVIVEGMAAAKPVIATNGGGVPEIVLDGITGILVPMGDEVSMAKAMDNLLRNPQDARRMGQAGRERALAKFTVQQTARMVQAVYSSVLAAR